MKSSKPQQQCHNRKHTVRWACDNCGTVSVNPELLCEPRLMDAEG